MKKSISLCEFSTTPSVSLMKDKRGQLLNHGAQQQNGAQQQQSPPPKAAENKKPQQEEEDMFALE